MADKSKVPTIILNGDKNITKDLQDHELIIIAPEKEKKKPARRMGTKVPGTPPKKKRFRDSPYPQFSQKKQEPEGYKGGGSVRLAKRGGGRAYGKNS